MHTNPALEQKRAALAGKLAALKLPPEVAETVRAADAAVSKFTAEAAALQGQIDEIDAQIGLRELDRRAAAQAAYEAQQAAQRKALADEAEIFIETIGEAEEAARALA